MQGLSPFQRQAIIGLVLAVKGVWTAPSSAHQINRTRELDEALTTLDVALKYPDGPPEPEPASQLEEPQSEWDDEEKEQAQNQESQDQK